MAIFTRLAAVALQNARLFDETRRRAIQQESLNAIIASAVLAPSVDVMIMNVVELAIRALAAEKGGIWIDEHIFLRGLPTDFAAVVSQALKAEGISLSATIVVENWKAVEESPESLTDPSPMCELAKLMISQNALASLSVPILAGKTRFGTLLLVSTQPRRWMREDVELAETVGQQVGSAFERLQLCPTSTTNHRYGARRCDFVGCRSERRSGESSR